MCGSAPAMIVVYGHVGASFGQAANRSVIWTLAMTVLPTFSSAALPLERALQGSPRTQEARLDGSSRDAEHAADLLEAEVVAVVERQERAIVDRQTSEGPVERDRLDRLVIEPAAVRAGEDSLAIDVVAPGSVDVDLSDALPVPQRQTAGVDEDPPEPGVEALGIAQPGEMAPRGDERLLRGVLGVRVIPQDRARRSIHRLDLPANEDVVRRSIAPAGGFHQLPLQAPSLPPVGPTGFDARDGDSVRSSFAGRETSGLRRPAARTRWVGP
jgi:hypothetical protein